jgi:Holliday junction DNA helicase RuvA
MIATLEGTVEHKLDDCVILNVSGIGYEINVSFSTLGRIPPEGRTVKMFITETTGIYGGGTNLYGFLSKEEKEIFLTFKDGLKNTGARKALDYLDKAVKSLPDFRRAVMERNIRALTTLFGFRSQTAEKILVLLKDKIPAVGAVTGTQWHIAGISGSGVDAVAALVALGYRESQAKHAVEEALGALEGRETDAGDLIKMALQHIQGVR